MGGADGHGQIAEEATDVYLSLPLATRAFDREVAVGAPSVLAVSLHNGGKIPRTLTLGSDAPENLRVRFDGDGKYSLNPGETRVVNVGLQATESLDARPLALTGSLDDGRKVVPLVFTVKTTPPVSAEGYTRALVLRNNTGSPAAVEVVPSKDGLFFTPKTVKAALPPSASSTAPIGIAWKDAPGAASLLNVPVFYELNVKPPQGQYAKPAGCVVFSPASGADVPPDFSRLPYVALPAQPGEDGFQADDDLHWVAGGLRITARIHDATPFQEQDGGALKDGGDCMIVAFDPEAGPAPDAWGAAYFECGFAMGRRGPASYIWDGRNGLESAKPFPEGVRHLSRDAGYVYYDVTIPEARLFPKDGSQQAGMSIAFVNRDAAGKSERIELGQGIFPEREPVKMGLLLRKK